MHTNLRRQLAIGLTVSTLAISALTSGIAVSAANPNDRFTARDSTGIVRDDPSDRMNVPNETLFPSTAAPVTSYTLGPSVFLAPASFVTGSTLIPGSFQIDRSLDRSGR